VRIPSYCDNQRLGDRDRQSAFTLLELLVVVAIVGILVSIFVPYFLNVREMNNRTRCAENLREIQVALRNYGTANGNAYPLVRQAPGVAGYTQYTGASANVDPFAENSPVRPNDVTASLWLLVRLELVSPQAFICPSSDATVQKVDGSISTFGNFSSNQHLSYSYATPFSVLPDYQLNSDRVRPEFAVMADMNPGVSADDDAVGSGPDAAPLALARGNSRNHGKVGQNVLYGSGIVEFQTTRFCGYGGDNIYTTLRATPIAAPEAPKANQSGILSVDAGPAWYSDSYLVPTAQQ
jgi:prepilin-type N-terminal cleavage/methylation domain-containing protein